MQTSLQQRILAMRSLAEINQAREESRKRDSIAARAILEKVVAKVMEKAQEKDLRKQEEKESA